MTQLWQSENIHRIVTARRLEFGDHAGKVSFSEESLNRQVASGVLTEMVPPRICSHRIFPAIGMRAGAPSLNLAGGHAA